MDAHTTERWKYSVCPALFFLVRHFLQDFFVLLNSSTPSTAAAVYPPMVPERNTAFRYVFSTIESNRSPTSSASSSASASRTASTFGILPRMKLPNRLPMLSGALKNVWKLSYCKSRAIKTGMIRLKNGIPFLFLLSVIPLIFCGIRYTLIA